MISQADFQTQVYEELTAASGSVVNLKPPDQVNDVTIDEIIHQMRLDFQQAHIQNPSKYKLRSADQTAGTKTKSKSGEVALGNAESRGLQLQ